MDYLIEKFDESEKEVSHISKQEIEKRVKRRFRDLMSNYSNMDVFEAKTQVKMEFSPQTADGFERLNRKLEFNLGDGNILEAYEQFLDGWLDEELERIFGNALKGPGSSYANKKVEKLLGGESKRIREEHSEPGGNKGLRQKLEKVGDMLKKLRRISQ